MTFLVSGIVIGNINLLIHVSAYIFIRYQIQYMVTAYKHSRETYLRMQIIRTIIIKRMQQCIEYKITLLVVITLPACKVGRRTFLLNDAIEHVNNLFANYVGDDVQ